MQNKEGLKGKKILDRNLTFGSPALTPDIFDGANEDGKRQQKKNKKNQDEIHSQ